MYEQVDSDFQVRTGFAPHGSEHRTARAVALPAPSLGLECRAVRALPPTFSKLLLGCCVGAGGEASAEGASDEGDGTAASGVRLLCAYIAAEMPSWDEVYAAEGTEAWLFDTGSQLAVVGSTGSTWVLAQAGYDALDADEGVAAPVSFQPIAQADEHLLAVFYNGSSIYKTVEGSMAWRARRARSFRGRSRITRT